MPRVAKKYYVVGKISYNAGQTRAIPIYTVLLYCVITYCVIVLSCCASQPSSRPVGMLLYYDVSHY